MYNLNIFAMLVFAATLCSMLLVLYSIKQHHAEKAYFLIFLSVTNFMYNFGYLQEITSATLETAFSSVRLQYMGLPFLLPISYLFVRDIYGQRRLNKVRLFLIFSTPFLSMLAMQTYPVLKIFYKNMEYISNGFIANCRVYPGPVYHLYTVYSYVIFSLILRLILRHLFSRESSRLKRQQSRILLVSCLVPMLCSIPYVFSTAKFRYDPTPASNTISMVLLLYSVRYHNLLNIVPLARAKVIESMDDAFIVCDKDFNFLDANEAAKRLFPVLKSLIPGDTIPGIERFKNSTELMKLLTDKGARCYRATQTPILQDAAVSGICFLLHDVTENEKLLKKLRIQASFDPLMRIYNRGTFFDLAKLMLCNGEAKHTPYALLLIDIDFFKRVNDTYGHPAGDAVLRSVALIVKNSFRKAEDIVGRYGGEEIVVLLGNVSMEQAFAASEKLRKTIEKTPVSYQKHSINITVSIGMAYSSGMENGHSLENMLNEADIEMYKAKNNGRNRTSPHCKIAGG
ncbi:histidine kinase N-terminal 7TM domain-containing diguanylate cyclase [Lacrimispora sp.]|uniref:histidine kinase N-terminal 7TM domain-containing diguanylate cyclase n=1 Tax=Lacrimispora sp. TaxID=2719234 RepID=UPI002FDA1B9A